MVRMDRQRPGCLQNWCANALAGTPPRSGFGAESSALQRLAVLRQIRAGRLISLVVLDFEALEYFGIGAAHHRRVQKVGAAQPVIESLEVAPDTYEGDLLAPVRVSLASHLGIDEPVVLPRVVQCLLGLLPEMGCPPGMDAALKDPDYQSPTPANSSLTPDRFSGVTPG